MNTLPNIKLLLGYVRIYPKLLTETWKAKCKTLHIFWKQLKLYHLWWCYHFQLIRASGVTDHHLQILAKNNPIEVYIYFFSDIYDREPNLSRGSQSSNKARKNSHKTLNDYRDVFEERWDLIKYLKYLIKVHTIIYQSVLRDLLLHCIT